MIVLPGGVISIIMIARSWEQHDVFQQVGFINIEEIRLIFSVKARIISIITQQQPKISRVGSHVSTISIFYVYLVSRIIAAIAIRRYPYFPGGINMRSG